MMIQLVWITLNHACNLKCNWCYQREVALSGKEMPVQTAKDLVDLCHDISAKIVILIGGEPTLYKGFFEVVRYIKSRGMTASVVTNGIKFSSEEFLIKAEEAGLDEVVLSVKGSSEEEYIASARINAFSLVRRAIRNLEFSKIRRRISVTVSESVIANWNSWINFVRGCEIKEINFSFEKPVILSDDVVFDDRMMSYNIADFIENEMYPLLLTSGTNFKIEFMFPQCALPKEFIEKLEGEGHAFGGCTVIGERGLAFDPEGYVLPCNHFVGNYFGQYGKDFKTATDFNRWFQSGDIQKFYRIIKSAPCDQCAECDRWSKCGGGCRIFWLYQSAEKLLTSFV